ncbi:MAG: molybdenum cofactor guanylyltransferase [Thermodesulfobacteriaceae bacterium]|nr:molybdenum cofactor guanylyltransferase [Thermodesulfobacteriaceae bacterium]MCX8042048.1 molybdenum cofactor guanylyltransferase [Thermodesulfobacteriaceae bacterium]MDW8136128.1 molybdenum cofactor guanylyltransferase [Thermodesulfobacterium sp.]
MSKLRAIILAGGEGLRIGQYKPLVTFLGKPLIFWVYSTLRKLFPVVYLSFKTEVQKKSLEKLLKFYKVNSKSIEFIPDIRPELRGPISGILSAMHFFPSEDSLLVLAVDQPLIQTDLLLFLQEISFYYPKCILVCQKEEHIEPFPGIYPCSLKKYLEEFIKVSEKKSLYRMFQFFLQKKSLLFLKDWNKVDLNGKSFININTLEQLKELEKKCFGLE